MKNTKIVFWISTTLFFLFESLLPALTSHTELAKEGISHLGYPDYFRILLAVCKVIGGIILIIPVIKPQIKEWAYAGFTFILIFACYSHAMVDGINFQTFFPLIVMVVLAVSYISHHKLIRHKATGF